MASSSRILIRTLAVFLSTWLAGGSAWALPTGWEVISGDVSFEQQDSVLNVVSKTPKAIIHYQSFNLGQGETVNFLLPSSLASILNRVLNGQTSVILGKINSNGQVLLVNPAGIRLGSSAQINTGAFLASSLGIRNQDYLSGTWRFRREVPMPGQVVNEGTIQAERYAVLLGSAVKNKGNIFSRNAVLGVGDEITLDVSPDMSVLVIVDEGLKGQLDELAETINNGGVIEAHSVQLLSRLEESLYQNVVNQDGIIRGTVINNEGGRIRIEGSSKKGVLLVRNTGEVHADGAAEAPSGGSIKFSGDRVEQAGTITADAAEGGTGGQVEITSRDFTDLQAGSLISASALGNTGSGGTVRIWSDQDTTLQKGARILANAGILGGDGGFIDLSAKHTVLWRGWMEARAPQGRPGTILLDPDDIVLQVGGGDVILDNAGANNPDNSGSPGTCDQLSGGTCTADPVSLDFANNLYLLANNSITVNSPVNLTTNGAYVRLELVNAGGTLDINNSITTQGGNIELAGNGATIDIDSAATLTSNGGNVVLNPGGTVNLNGDIAAGAGQVQINSTSSVTVGNTSSVTGTGIDVTGTSISVNGATLDAGAGDLALSTNSTAAGNINVAAGSNLSGRDITFNGGATVAGSQTATQDLVFGRAGQADALVYSGTGTADRDILLRGSGNQDVRGTLQADNNLTLTGSIFHVNAGSFNPQLIADADNSGAGTLTLHDATYNNDNLTLDGASIVLNDSLDTGTGTLTVNGPVTLNNSIALDGGTLFLNHDFALGNNFLTINGPVNTSNNSISLSGNANAARVTLGAGNTINTGTGTLTLQGDLINLFGNVTGGGLTVTGGNFFRNLGTILVTGDVDVTALDINFQNTITAANIIGNGPTDIPDGISLSATNDILLGRVGINDAINVFAATLTANHDIHLRGIGGKEVRGILRADNDLSVIGSVGSADVGVHTAELSADADNSGTGTLTVNSVSYNNDNLTLDGASIVLNGDATAGTGTLNVNGPTSTGGASRALTGGTVNINGSVNTGAGNLTVNGTSNVSAALSGNDITLAGTANLNNGAGITATGNVTAGRNGQADTLFIDDTVTVASDGNVLLRGNGAKDIRGSVSADNDLTVTGGAISHANAGSFNVNLTADADNSGAGTLSLGGASYNNDNLTLRAADMTLSGTIATGSGTLDISASSGNITTGNNDLSLSAGAIQLGSLSITAGSGNLTFTGDITADDLHIVSANTLTVNDDYTSATGDFTANATNSIGIHGNVSASSGDITLTTTNAGGAGILLSAAKQLDGNVTLNSASALTLNGDIQGQGPNTQLTGNNVTITGTINAQDLAITGQGAAPSLSIQIASDIDAGNNTVTVSGFASGSIDGRIDGNLTVSNPIGIGSTAQITAPSNITLGRAGQSDSLIIDPGASLSSGGDILLQSNGTIEVRSNLSADNNLIVNGTLSSANAAADNVTLTADADNSGTGTLTVNSVSYNNDNLTLDGASIVLNGDATAGTGTLNVNGPTSTGGASRALTGGTVNINGSVNTGAGNLTVNGTSNVSAALSGNDITLAGTANLNNGAGITATGNVSMGRNAQADDILVEDAVSVNSDGDINLRGTGNKDVRGDLSADGDLDISGPLTHTDAGSFDVTLTADADNSGAGTLSLGGASYNNDNLTLRAADMTLSGTIATGSGTLDISASSGNITTANNNLTLDGASVVLGATTLTAGSGNLTLDGPVTANSGSLTIASAATVNVNNTVDTNASFNATASDGITVDAAINASGGTTYLTTTNAAGPGITLTANASLDSDVRLDSQSNLTVANGASITGKSGTVTTLKGNTVQLDGDITSEDLDITGQGAGATLDISQTSTIDTGNFNSQVGGFTSATIDGRIDGNLTVSNPIGIGSTAQITAPSNITLGRAGQSDSLIIDPGASLSSGGDILLQSNGTIEVRSNLSADNNLIVNGTLSSANAAADNVTLTADADNSGTGTLTVNSVSYNNDNLTLDGASIVLNGDATAGTGDLDIGGPVVTNNNNVRLSANQITMTGTSMDSGTGTLTIDAPLNTGGSNLQIDGANFEFTGGTLDTGAGNLTINSNADTLNTDATITGSALSFNGLFLGGNSLIVTAATDITLNDTMSAGNLLNLTAGGSILSNCCGQVSATGLGPSQINLRAGGIIGNTLNPLDVQAPNNAKVTVEAAGIQGLNSVVMTGFIRPVNTLTLTANLPPGRVIYNGRFVYDPFYVPPTGFDPGAIGQGAVIHTDPRQIRNQWIEEPVKWLLTLSWMEEDKRWQRTMRRLASISGRFGYPVNNSGLYPANHVELHPALVRLLHISASDPTQAYVDLMQRYFGQVRRVTPPPANPPQ